MSEFPWSSKGIEASFSPLESNGGFLLDLEGHKVVALRLPSKVAKEISGQEMETSGGILSKLKAKLGLTPETGRWLTVTSVYNPMLEEPDRFEALVAQGLTNATGAIVTKSNVAISASVPINRKGQPPDAVEGDGPSHAATCRN